MFYTNTFDEMVRLKDIFDRFFDDIPSGAGRIAEYPYINVYEKDDSVMVRAVVPGVSNEDLNIELMENSLVIEGERKMDLADKPYVRRERSFGKFKKSVRLPYRVDRDKIEASVKDGILIVKMEKSDEARPKRITIK